MYVVMPVQVTCPPAQVARSWLPYIHRRINENLSASLLGSCLLCMMSPDGLDINDDADYEILMMQETQNLLCSLHTPTHTHTRLEPSL